MKQYLTAKEAADMLGISLPTLYSYVSRGLVRSEQADSRKRTRRYRLEDVEKLKQRQEQRKNPAVVVENALHWGAPLLDSTITLIEDNRYYYRGRDVVALIANYSVEQVAALIWVDSLIADLPLLFDSQPVELTPPMPAVQQQVAGQSAVEQFQVLLPLAAATDYAAYDLQPDSVVQTGSRILRLLATIASGDMLARGNIATKLQQGWVPADPQAAQLLNAALILCADHELNVSSFTARCVASAGATPYQVVLAGLSALQGVKHGRLTERVDAFMQEIKNADSAQTVIAGRLKRGEIVPGFGHQLYPGGDPRGAALLEMVSTAYPDSPAVAQANQVASVALDLLGKQPTVDFGLVLLAQALNLPPDKAITLFALGRTIGWIGHAIEQYRTDRIIRPRARYVGEQPVRGNEKLR